MYKKQKLDIDILCKEANSFSVAESKHNDSALFGITDGKAVGTYFEHKFKNYLAEKYFFSAGNSASGIDFPDIEVDMKVTSIKQPQSSCPYKSARQKIWGLGYSVLIFVYNKTDDENTKTGKLDVLHSIFIKKEKTGDYQTTTGLKKIIENNGNTDDIIAFLYERMLPVNEIEAEQMAKDIINTPPETGYLTISNALQWRLQYSRVLKEAGKINGIIRIY